MRVTASALGHSFNPERPLFDNLEFMLSAGELVALTGPSGSGKSTLLSILAKWEEPSSGTVTWKGIDSVGWVFQNPLGAPGRTVLDHAAYPLIAQGLRRSAANAPAMVALSRFGLEKLADQTYSTLSGGEAQRLMLARAVVKAPSLLLVDEPTAQLDPRSAETVNAVLNELAQANCIVVVATHDLNTRDACHRTLNLGRSVRTERKGGHDAVS